MSRMGRARFGLVMESVEQQDEIIETQDLDSQIDKDLLEINNSEDEVSANEDKVNSASDVVEALESMRDLMGVAAQNGGMDKYSASIISVAVGHMYSTVGIKASSMPSLESFNDPENCAYSTKLVMEGITEGISKIWKIIMDAIKKSIQWVKDFFGKIFGANEKIAAKAEEMLVEAKQPNNPDSKANNPEPVNEHGYNEKEYGDLRAEAKRRTAERNKGMPKHYSEVNFTDNALFLKLQINNVFPEKFYTIFSSFCVLADEIFSCKSKYNYVAAADVFHNDYSSFSKKEIDEKSLEYFIKNLYLAEPNTMSYLTAKGNHEHKNPLNNEPGMLSLLSITMFGNKYLISTRNEKLVEGEEVVALLQKSDFRLDTYIPKNSPSAEKNIQAIHPDDIIENIIAISDMCVKIGNIKKEFALSEKIKEEFLQFAEDIESGKTDFSKAPEGKNIIAKIIKAYLHLIDKPLVTFLPYALTVNAAVLEYIEKSNKAMIAD